MMLTDKQQGEPQAQSAALKGTLQVKGVLHFHRADGSVVDVPFKGEQIVDLDQKEK